MELGELAKETGQSIPAKELGARMVVEHGRIARELKQLALNKGLRVGDTKRPEEPSYDMLTKLSSPGLRQGVLGGDGQGSGMSPSFGA